MRRKAVLGFVVGVLGLIVFAAWGWPVWPALVVVLTAAAMFAAESWPMRDEQSAAAPIATDDEAESSVESEGTAGSIRFEIYNQPD